MNIAKSMTDLIGNTPMVRLDTLSRETGNEIIVKLESFNPLSSVKDRPAFAMIEKARREGKIKPGGLLIEPTSGNTGIGLAFIAASMGYRLILTMPESMSIERRKLLQALGAELVLTPAEGGMKAAISKAQELIDQHPGSFMPQQFTNPANPQVHRDTTAREIIKDTDGKIDYFVAGIGTGGTITGVGEVLNSEIPGVQVIAEEPEESPNLSAGDPGPHKIQGIGAGFVPEVLNTGIFDRVLTVPSLAAAQMARGMAKTEGLLIGISSGAALAAAREAALEVKDQGKIFVVVLPDSGERYLSTWLFSE